MQLKNFLHLPANWRETSLEVAQRIFSSFEARKKKANPGSPADHYKQPHSWMIQIPYFQKIVDLLKIPFFFRGL